MDQLLSSLQEAALFILSYLPLGYIFPHMEWILLAYCAYCIIPCLRIKSRSSLVIVAYLAALLSMGWLDVIWDDTSILLLVHGAALSLLVITHVLSNSLVGKFGNKILQLGLMMIAVDVIAIGIDPWLWIHQSFINVIFFLMLKSTRRAGNNSVETMQEIRQRTENKDGVASGKVKIPDFAIPFHMPTQTN